MNRVISNIIFLLGLCIAVSLQGSRIASLNSIQHDDGISYLSATGHQGHYAENIPAGQWVVAKAWKQYWQSNIFGHFKTIGEDLAHWDIHPPLYFWILHAWIAVVGTELWTGPILNIFFFTCSYWLLYLLARRVLGSSLLAALLVLTWGLSPAVFRISDFTRQYSLLTLCALFYIFMLYCVTYSSQTKILYYGGLSLSTMLGLLTHYYFILLVSGGIAVSIIEVFFQKASPKRFFIMIGSIMIGIAIFILLHPHFGVSLLRQQQVAQNFSFTELPLRIKRVLISFIIFFSPFDREYIIGYGMFWGIVCFMVVRSQRRQLTWQNTKPILIQHRYILMLFFWLTSSVIGLYIGFVSPQHAMGERYLAFVYPLLAFLPFIILLPVQRLVRYSVVICLCVGQLLYSVIDTYGYCSKLSQERIRFAALGFSQSSVILLDSVARGVLPTILWHVPDTASVFAGSQDLLLAEPESWLTQISTPAFYVSHLTYHNNTIEKRELIISQLEEHGIIVQPANVTVYGAGTVYYLLQGTHEQ